MSFLSGEFRAGALPALPVFIFSRRHLPDRRAAGLPQLRPSIPAGKFKRGCQPCEEQAAGMAQVAVERQRRQEDRSATGSSLLLFLNPAFQFEPTLEDETASGSHTSGMGLGSTPQKGQRGSLGREACCPVLLRRSAAPARRTSHLRAAGHRSGCQPERYHMPHSYPRHVRYELESHPKHALRWATPLTAR